jgi:hypothetical protein
VILVGAPKKMMPTESIQNPTTTEVEKNGGSTDADEDVEATPSPRSLGTQHLEVNPARR